MNIDNRFNRSGLAGFGKTKCGLAPLLLNLNKLSKQKEQYDKPHM